MYTDAMVVVCALVQNVMYKINERDDKLDDDDDDDESALQYPKEVKK